MKIFRVNIWGIIISVCTIYWLSGCNQYSEGLQRKKFEFLYKLSNYTALLREYTYGINYFSDLDFYENRIKKVYEDVNKMKTIDEWGTSRLLKEKFLSTTDDNLNSVNTLRKKMLPSAESIKKEYDVILMNERVEIFNNELDEEISKAGKN